MISCQQERQRNRNKCWEFSAIDFVGLTGFRCSVHINYTHLFMVCYWSIIAWIFSAELGPSACLAIINVQFMKWLDKKGNKHIIISLLGVKRKFCFILILTQRHDPCESKQGKKFTGTGEPRSADVLQKFYKLASFLCSLITIYGLGTASVVDQWFGLWITLVTHRSAKSLYYLLGMFYWDIQHISRNK